MAHDVFISHSSKDKPIADAVCAALESNKFRCWIAPRDILPGKSWPEAIAQAIASGRIMVLIYSAESSSSEQVKREISTAIDEKVIIVPFKIGGPPLEGEFKFFLKSTHWLDAMDPPTEYQIGELVKTVSLLMDSTQVNGTGNIIQPKPRKPWTNWFKRSPRNRNVERPRKKLVKVLIWVSIAVFLLLFASLIEVVPNDPTYDPGTGTPYVSYPETLTLPQGFPIDIVPIIQNAQLNKSTKQHVYQMNYVYNVSYVVNYNPTEVYEFYKYYLGEYQDYSEYGGNYGEIHMYANYGDLRITVVLYTNSSYSTTVEIILIGVQ